MTITPYKLQVHIPLMVLLLWNATRGAVFLVLASLSSSYDSLYVDDLAHGTEDASV